MLHDTKVTCPRLLVLAKPVPLGTMVLTLCRNALPKSLPNKSRRVAHVLALMMLGCVPGKLNAQPVMITNTAVITNFAVPGYSVNVAINPALNKIYLSDGYESTGRIIVV